MNQIFKANKQVVRDFMQKHYTDARLAELLAHAQDGKLAYYSCCCFIGIPTSDHALVGADRDYGRALHYKLAANVEGAAKAEVAFCGLAQSIFGDGADALRQRVLIPMIRAEMKRRSNLAKATMAATHEATHEPATEHIEKVSV